MIRVQSQSATTPACKDSKTVGLPRSFFSLAVFKLHLSELVSNFTVHEILEPRRRVESLQSSAGKRALGKTHNRPCLSIFDLLLTLRKPVERFSRVRRSNNSKSHVTAGAEMTSTLVSNIHGERSRRHVLGEAPLYSGRNVLVFDPYMRTSLHAKHRRRSVETIEMVAMF